MATGNLKFFDYKSGCGVVAPDAGTQDLLVYVAGIEPCDLPGLTRGQMVHFDLHPDGDGGGIVNLMLASTWLEWKPELSVGIQSVDAQHKDAIACYIRLLRSLNPDRDTTGFQRAFRELLECTREHFADEERLLRNIGFDEYEDHKHAHTKLIRDAEDFAINVRSQFDAGACTAVAKWFRWWLLDHIEKQDLKIERFLHRES